jgi:ribose-phosphate pyrophosphokinase
MFEIKKFNSGEKSVRITERLSEFKVHWNWFNEDEQDIMIPLMKADAIKRQYGNVPILLNASYLPYSRQDRMFEIGQAVPMDLLQKIFSNYFDHILCMALHGVEDYKSNHIPKYPLLLKQCLSLEYLPFFSYYNFVFPDKNAGKHFNASPEQSIYFEKIRDESGKPKLVAESYNNLSAFHRDQPFLICDDICDGGRTFVECAKLLKENFGNDKKIELIIYHAFLTHGLEDLKNSGISKIHIINPDSYGYIIKKYPNDLNYFNYQEIQ